MSNPVSTRTFSSRDRTITVFGDVAYAEPGEVEFDFDSGRMTPAEARAAVDALHAAVHAAADFADAATPAAVTA